MNPGATVTRFEAASRSQIPIPAPSCASRSRSSLSRSALSAFMRAVTSCQRTRAPATVPPSRTGEAVARISRVRPSARVTVNGRSTISSPASARESVGPASVTGAPSGERTSKMQASSAGERPASGRSARASAMSFAATIRPPALNRTAGCRMVSSGTDGGGIADWPGK